MQIDRKQLKPYSSVKPKNQPFPSILGVWQNELGSTMTVASVNGQNFTGTYASAVSEGQQPVTGTLSGTLAGDAIGFSVNWSPTYNSVTSWSGLVLTNGEELFLYSLWNLASTPENQADFWQSVLAGADLFVQMTAQKK
jgi:hypothetical protein